MKGWIRIGVVLSAFWMAGVLVFAIAEFLMIPAGSCVKAENGWESPSIQMFFFQCSMFSDLRSISSGDYLITWGRQLVEFHAKRFLFLLIAPIGSSWLIAITVFWAWRWVVRGFKE